MHEKSCYNPPSKLWRWICESLNHRHDVIEDSIWSCGHNKEMMTNYKVDVIPYNRSFMTIPLEMAVPKDCNVCGKIFSNKSNLNRHQSRVHKRNKRMNLHEVVKLKRKITNNGLNIHKLNKVLWNIVLQLIENKRLSPGLSKRISI